MIVPPANHGRRSFASAVLARDQTADAGRVAENLVEGLRYEIGPPAAEVQPIGGRECGGVEQHVPAVLLCERNPVERMLHARKVRLRRIGEQSVATARRPRKMFCELAHRRRACRAAPPGRRSSRQCLRARELADAVHRVVIVEGQKILAAGIERIRFANQLQGLRRIRREYRPRTRPDRR